MAPSSNISARRVIGEVIVAFLIVAGVPASCWIYYWLTGHPLNFGGPG